MCMSLDENVINSSKTLEWILTDLSIMNFIHENIEYYIKILLFIFLSSVYKRV